MPWFIAPMLVSAVEVDRRRTKERHQEGKDVGNGNESTHTSQDSIGSGSRRQL